MKTPSDHLWKLICSLTKSEKRYFKIYAERHVLGEKNNYLKFFEVIEKQEVYDEEKLKEQFKDEKFSSYIPVAKQYLFSMILDSLHAYEQNSSSEQQIKKMIHHAEILFNKGLIRSCEKTIAKAKKQAYEMEKYSCVIECLDMEKRLMAKRYYKNISAEDLRAVQEEEEQVVQKIGNMDSYWYLSARIFSIQFQKGSTRNKEDLRELDELLNDPLMEDLEKAETYRSKLDFFQIKATYHFLKKEEEKAYEYNFEYLRLFERYPEKIQEYPGRYLSCLNNFLIDSLALKKYDEILPGIKRMRDLREHPVFKRIENLNVDIFRLSYMIELNLYISEGSFEKGLSILPEVIKGLQDYDKQIVKSNHISFYYLMAYIYFGNGEYDNALTWLNKIINDTDEMVSQDIFAFARIISLIVHYELNNLDLLEYLIKSTYRYLKKRKKLYALEKDFLRFIRKINHTNIYDKQEMQQQFIKLKAELEPLLNDPYEKKAFDYFDFISWLDSKIDKKPFLEIVKKKNRYQLN